MRILRSLRHYPKTLYSKIPPHFFSVSLKSCSNNRCAHGGPRLEEGQKFRVDNDGMVDPPTAPISLSADNITYYLTSNILGRIAVQRDNIVVDGAGYTIQDAQNGTGIYLTGRCNVTIKNMEIKAFAFGIRLYLSSKITISGNNITSNDYGIQLYDSSSNIIYNNNFVDNAEQVFSAGSINVWDNGYPSGGNYWSNYADVDQYSGPYQNETGSDEIWDNPYLIDEYNVDNYPIVPEFPTKASTLLILTVLAVAIGIHKRTLPNTLARV